MDAITVDAHVNMKMLRANRGGGGGVRGFFQC